MTSDHKLHLLGQWRERLHAIANEMDQTTVPEIVALADHIDSITDDLLYQQRALTAEGPIVVFKGFKP